MPARDETAFGALEVSATTTRRSQKSGGASGSATESRPSVSSRSAWPPPKTTDASTERLSSVSEMLPVAGRLRARSRFPQYFTSARFTLARAVVAGAAIPGGCLLSLWLASRTIGYLTDHSRPIGQAAAQENPRDPGKPSGPAGIAPDRVSPLYRMYRGVCQRSASTLPAPNA